MLRRVVKRVRSGQFQLRLSADERDVLRSLPEQLKEMLTEDDPALRRLFPPAYLDDPKAETEYHRLMREDLLEHHRTALDVMAATIDADQLDEDQLTSWMGAINDLRLVLGTKLDVSEDEVQLETPADHLYHYLGYLMEEIVVALSSRYE